ncbi:putative ABC transporter ATP-binding protein [Austwickia sp. TVS 96-490-7B]|uniref:thiol reductant ABC exporter subunit CydC n=1 Tax=Austwickia sp. TVS 96-490-7B TaxID=2830843 RepID=UPI001C55F72E|nr:thiol reductant ABC exporter subunit CydC [Austwickia sp. TVS 96-490-7B]MBW3084024.1 putative ABC transporter ATP-binding protein [Austwickia sp. TVS 96-490-7B]
MTPQPSAADGKRTGSSGSTTGGDDAAVPGRVGGRPRIVPGVMSAALVGGVALTCGVALTTTAGWLIVAASYHPQILTLLAAIVLVRAVGIARPALRYVERVRSHDAALRFLADERARTYERLIPLTPARLGRRSRGDVLAGVVDDLDDIAYAQVRVVVPFVALVVTAGLAALANAVILFPAAAVTLSTAACTLVVGWVDHRLESRRQEAVVAARAEVSRVSTLITDNALEIAAIGAQASATQWLDDAQAALGRALRSQSWGRAVGVTLVPLVTVAHAAVMAAVVSTWVPQGLPTPLAAFLLLTPIALGEVTAAIPDAVGAAARARGAAHRLDTLLNQTAAVRDPATVAPTLAVGPGGVTPPPVSWRDSGGHDTVPPELSLDRVTASWDGERAAMQRLSTAIKPGRHVAVVGPNGSGKSTLLAVLARHIDPASGAYRVDGEDVTRLALSQVRAHLAVVDDEPHVFASSLRENMRFALPDCSDAQIESALQLAGLHPWYSGLPEGLDTRLGSGGQGVSGGERARLSIARAVLSHRPVLLLDEPVAHLDHPTAVAVMADVRRSSQGRTVVVVAHRAEGIDNADEVLDLTPEAPTPLAGPR